jgi:GcrA cell cycle regulator
MGGEPIVPPARQRFALTGAAFRKLPLGEQRVVLEEARHQYRLSAQQIALEMGDGITRNSINSKMHRMGIAPLAKPPKPKVARSPKPRPKIVRPPQEPRPEIEEPSASIEELLAPAHWAPLDDAAPVALFDHREGMCRWPVEREDLRGPHCCGQPVREGEKQVYCEAHYLRSVSGYTAGQSVTRILKGTMEGKHRHGT